MEKEEVGYSYLLKGEEESSFYLINYACSFDTIVEWRIYNLC